MRRHKELVRGDLELWISLSLTAEGPELKLFGSLHHVLYSTNEELSFTKQIFETWNHMDTL